MELLSEFCIKMERLQNLVKEERVVGTWNWQDEIPKQKNLRDEIEDIEKRFSARVVQLCS